ncbi:MAG: hypothetical protein KatS3mg089_0357 [Patescibacteria group bacterium]|nr:MAG: hypothetical protein KatS3mg089_0357 [Patescibacteria group bacterium]
MVDEYEKIYKIAQKQHAFFIRVPSINRNRVKKQLAIDFLPDFS